MAKKPIKIARKLAGLPKSLEKVEATYKELQATEREISHLEKLRRKLNQAEQKELKQLKQKRIRLGYEVQKRPPSRAKGTHTAIRQAAANIARAPVSGRSPKKGPPKIAAAGTAFPRPRPTAVEQAELRTENIRKEAVRNPPEAQRKGEAKTRKVKWTEPEKVRTRKAPMSYRVIKGEPLYEGRRPVAGGAGGGTAVPPGGGGGPTDPPKKPKPLSGAERARRAKADIEGKPKGKPTESVFSKQVQKWDKKMERRKAIAEGRGTEYDRLGKAPPKAPRKRRKRKDVSPEKIAERVSARKQGDKIRAALKKPKLREPKPTKAEILKYVDTTEAEVKAMDRAWRGDTGAKGGATRPQAGPPPKTYGSGEGTPGKPAKGSRTKGAAPGSGQSYADKLWKQAKQVVKEGLRGPGGKGAKGVKLNIGGPLPMVALLLLEEWAESKFKKPPMMLKEMLGAHVRDPEWQKASAKRAAAKRLKKRRQPTMMEHMMRRQEERYPSPKKSRRK